jgi:hypothetical protein
MSIVLKYSAYVKRAKSRGFSPGALVSSHRESLHAGWVRINTVKKIIS